MPWISKEPWMIPSICLDWQLTFKRVKLYMEGMIYCKNQLQETFHKAIHARCCFDYMDELVKFCLPCTVTLFYNDQYFGNNELELNLT